MKVLKPGRDQKGWSTEQTCTGSGNGDGGCGAVLLVEQADVYRTFRHCRDETDVFNTFSCSACGVETDISKPASVPFVPPTRAAWMDAEKARILADVKREGTS